MDMTFPVTVVPGEEEMEIVTGDTTKAVEEEEVVTVEAMTVTITPAEAMTKEEAMKEITTTPETIPETVVDIADMTKKLTALK